MNMADMNNNSHFYDCSRRYNDDECYGLLAVGLSFAQYVEQ